LLNDGRRPEAADALRRALAIRPDDPVIRARHAVSSGRTAEARTILAAALAERPELRPTLARDPALAALLP